MGIRGTPLNIEIEDAVKFIMAKLDVLDYNVLNEILDVMNPLYYHHVKGRKEHRFFLEEIINGTVDFNIEDYRREITCPEL